MSRANSDLRAKNHAYVSVPSQQVFGGRNVNMMNWALSVPRMPFTSAQFIELAQQISIHQRIRNNVPIPQNLLFSLQNGRPVSLQPAARNADPKSGRCRRTDGRKWRCSKLALPDQKYCERHINRGREYRFRKLVEGRHKNGVEEEKARSPQPHAIDSGHDNNISLPTQSSRIEVSGEKIESNHVANSHDLSMPTANPDLLETLALSPLNTIEELSEFPMGFGMDQFSGRWIWDAVSGMAAADTVAEDWELWPEIRSSPTANGSSAFTGNTNNANRLSNDDLPTH